MRAEEVITEVAKLCREFYAAEVILYGSRARGTARERSDRYQCQIQHHI